MAPLPSARRVTKPERRGWPYRSAKLLVPLAAIGCLLSCTRILHAVWLQQRSHPDDIRRSRAGDSGRNQSDDGIGIDNWDGLLAEISPQRELIVTATTCGYLDMTLNWIAQLNSIRAENFLVIAEDLPTYEYLLRVIPRRTLPSHFFGRPFSRTAKQAARFDSHDFDWCSRPYYLKELIKRNFRAVWVDSDAMLLRNPYKVAASSADVILVDDEPALLPITKYRHYYCSCFVMVRPSQPANAFLSTWAHLCANRTQDQPPMNEALDVLGGAVSWTRLPKPLYPSGYDAERLTLLQKPGWESPAWIHANWREGVVAKEQFLSRFGLWRNIRAPLQCNA